MHITILTFDGFNELDSFIALGILNRVKRSDWRVSIASPTEKVTSMNGLTIHRQANLAEVTTADAVIVGSGIKTLAISQDEDIMAQLQLNPNRQLIGAQCSGALLLAKLGLLKGVPACTDLTSKPWVQEAGIRVLNQAFYTQGNLATAGGCLASQYLAFWILARLENLEAAKDAMYYVAPVGEKEEYVQQAMQHISRLTQEESFV